MNHREVTRRYIKALEIRGSSSRPGRPPSRISTGASRRRRASSSRPTAPSSIPGSTRTPDGFDAAIAKQLEKVKAAPVAATCAPPPDSPARGWPSKCWIPTGRRSPWRLSSIARRWSTCGRRGARVRGGDPGAPEVRREPREVGRRPTGHDLGGGRGVGRAHRGVREKLNLSLRSNRAPSGGLAEGLDLSYRSREPTSWRRGASSCRTAREARSGTTRWSGRECSRAFANAAGLVK